MLTEFVGAPSATAWSRVEELRVTDLDTVYVAFAVIGVDAGTIGREVVAHLRAEKPDSFENVYEFLKKMDTLVNERGAQLSLAAGFVGAGEGGWITSNGSVALLREDAFGNVASGPGLSVKAGSLREDDVYILSTASGSGLADEVRLLKERGYKLDGSISTIERLLQTHPHSDQTAVALLHVVPTVMEAASQVEAEEVFAVNQLSQSVLSEQKPLVEESFKPRRLSLDEESQAQHPSIGAGDRKLTFLDRLKIVALVVWPFVLSFGKVVGKLSRGLTRSVVALVNALLQKMGKRPMLTKALPGDVSGPVRGPLSTKKVVAMVTTGVAVLLLLLFLIIGFVLWRKNIVDQAQAFVSPYNSRLQTAVQLHRLDPVRGRDQLERLLEEIRTAQAESKKGSEQRKAVDEVLARAEAKLNEIVGSEALVNVPVWLDLQYAAPGFVANEVSSQLGWIVVADTGQQRGFLIDIASSNPYPINLAGITKITDLDLRANNEVITLGNGINRVSLTDEQLVEFGEPTTFTDESDSNRDATLIASFDSNLYVFNPVSRRIYRYAESNGSLGAATNWLSSTLGVQAEDVYDMAVDGSIWLTTKTGQLLKFASGRSTSFQMSQLPEEPVGPVSIVTHPDFTYLYLFVPNQGKVLVLTKEGVFVRQIKSTALAGATDIAVDETSGQLYIISGSVIYQVPLLAAE